MVKVGLVASVCAAAVAAIGATSALGNGPPTGNCPVGFDPQPTSFLDDYSVGGLQSADLNGNQMTCVKLLDTPSDIVFMDDVVPH
jgi:hypothetical protein